MTHLARLGAVLVLLTLGAGCTVAKISGRGSVPLMLNTPPQKVKVIRHFVAQKMVTFDYTGAFDVSEVLADKLEKTEADAITNLTVTIKSTFSSFLVNMVTLGLANAKVMAVEGDLVSIEGGASSLLETHEVVASAGPLERLPLDEIDSHTSLARLPEGFALVRRGP